MISSSFFFLFSELGVGMALALLAISPRKVGPSFFTFASSTAAVLMGVTLGFNFLFPSQFRDGNFPVVTLFASALLLAAYNRVVLAGKYGLAQGLLIAATATGLVSVASDALAFTRIGEGGGWGSWAFLASHLAATILLGSVTLTMVFGHWYLVIPGLSIDHLKVLTRFLSVAIAIRVVTVAVTLAVPSGISRALGAGLFFWPRVLFGVAAPIVLAAMIWNTVKIHHTQAATGFLYLAVVALLFGEFFSKFLLFEIRLPL
jgi:protein NrfD